MKTVKVKGQGGSYFFELEDSNGERVNRVFSVEPRKVTSIPVHYAKSLYNKPATLEWLEKGKLIIVEGKEELEDMLIEENYIQEPVKAVNHAELINILKGNNLTRVKELFEGENKDLALKLAGLHSAELTQGVITYIESHTGISLRND